MRTLFRNIRNNRFVLAVLVTSLQIVRSLSFCRSRAIYRHVPYRGVVKVDCGKGKEFLIYSYGHKIENSLYWGGLFSHEPESMRLWIECASQAETVLDVGANSGVFALAAAAVGAGNVHAFEPLPRMHSLLERNVGLNCDFPVQTWQLAVGSSDGESVLFDPGGDAPTSASLSEGFATSKFGRLPATSVRVATIDAFCYQQSIKAVDLIKIDVEGYEEHALYGMRKIVATCKPKILLEVLPGRETTLRALVEQLWPALYAWDWIDEGGKNISRNVMLTPY